MYAKTSDSVMISRNLLTFRQPQDLFSPFCKMFTYFVCYVQWRDFIAYCVCMKNCYVCRRVFTADSVYM